MWVLAAGNAVGGYVVTERMLEMFKPPVSWEAAEGFALMFTGNACPLRYRRELPGSSAFLFIFGLKQMSSPVTA